MNATEALLAVGNRCTTGLAALSVTLVHTTLTSRPASIALQEIYLGVEVLGDGACVDQADTECRQAGHGIANVHAETRKKEIEGGSCGDRGTHVDASVAMLTEGSRRLPNPVQSIQRSI